MRATVPPHAPWTPPPPPARRCSVEHVSPHERQWQAECVLAEALSAFQADLKPATDFTLAAVVTAAKPAFAMGFSFSVQSSGEGTVVVLMHKDGAQLSAETSAYDADFALSARLLAGLLGIPVQSQAQPSKAGETTAELRRPLQASNSPVPALTQSSRPPLCARAGGDPEPRQPAPAGARPGLEPLEPQEIATLTAMLKAMARSDKEIWKRFTIAFRSQFQVPSTARTITDRVTQRRHADFIDRFERESGVPPAAANASGSGAAARYQRPDGDSWRSHGDEEHGRAASPTATASTSSPGPQMGAITCSPRSAAMSGRPCSNCASSTAFRSAAPPIT